MVFAVIELFIIVPLLFMVWILEFYDDESYYLISVLKSHVKLVVWESVLLVELVILVLCVEFAILVLFKLPVVFVEFVTVELELVVFVELDVVEFVALVELATELFPITAPVLLSVIV